ncbi:flavin reductase family protein [Alphaproteobacteria bacterium]|nr:flavin reductase family protein [Alphaproteobacteria bacterium]
MKKKQTLTSVFSLFSTGITIVTNGTKKSEYFGCTINSFTSVSLKPAMFLFCLGNDNKHLETFKLQSPLNINILSNSQKSLSNKFAGRLEDRWKNLDYDLSKNKVPYFKNSLGLIEAKVFQKILAGDHTILLCKIINYSNFNSKKPLIYYKSKYQTI